MNKIFALLIALACLFASDAAAASANASSTLVLTTNQGARKAFVLRLAGGQVTLNGYALDESATVVNRDAIAYAFSIASSPEPRTCSSGLYEHVVKRRGKTRRERGCLEQQRLASLYSAFRELERTRGPSR